MPIDLKSGGRESNLDLVVFPILYLLSVVESAIGDPLAKIQIYIYFLKLKLHLMLNYWFIFDFTAQFYLGTVIFSSRLAFYF